MPTDGRGGRSDRDRPLTRSALERAAYEESPDLHLMLLDDPCAICLFVSGGRGMPWLPQDLEGRSLLELVHPRDLLPVRSALQRARDDRAAAVVFRLKLPEGGSRRCEMEVRGLDRPTGRPVLVAVLRDVETVDGLPREVLLRVEAIDPVTGLLSRAVFLDRVKHALQRITRVESQVALLFIDLDRFKDVNDSLGHRAGDRLLRELSRRLADVLRPADTLARIGGDEFAVLLEDLAGPQEACRLATRMAEVGRHPVDVDGHEVLCTMSVGVAVSSDGRHTVETLLNEADLAMYRAKQRGRDRTELFDDRLRHLSMSRLSTERLLRRAIDEHRLRLEYQPVVRLPDAKVVRVEALLRIERDDDEPLHPPDFLEVAGSSGLLRELDLWVLDAALSEAARWQQIRGAAAMPLPISLNLGGRDLVSPSFGDRVLDRLDRYELSPSLLQLEVKEEVLSRATPMMNESVEALRSAGVGVGLDDYGTGQTSIGQLGRFPVDFVKLDRSVVAQLPGSRLALAMARAVVDIAHALGLPVVGEGVESTAELAVLAELGCDEGQGHLWSPSTDSAHVLDLVAREALPECETA